MKRAVIVLICYLLFLFGFSLFCSRLGIAEFKPNPSTFVTLEHPMMLATIFAGLIALRCSITFSSFRVFVIVYSFLWFLRIPVNYFNIQITNNLEWYKHYGFNRFTFRYYDSVTRICTPLPFIFYWFINYFFGFVSKRYSNESSGNDGKTSAE